MISKPSARDSLPNPVTIRPFGLYGAGSYTGHPIGLVIVLGLLLIGLLAFPAARLFFLGAIPLGALMGVLLWLRHRSN